MSVSTLILEEFGEASFAPEPPQQDPAEAYMAGYAAGEAAVQQKLQAAETAFIDAAHSLDEALKTLPVAAEAALAEAVHTCLAALLPVLTERGFAAEASAAIARAFAGAPSGRVEIAAAPQQTQALIAALAVSGVKGDFVVVEDAALSTAAARATCGRGGFQFDLDAAREACLSSLAAALGALSDGKQR